MAKNTKSPIAARTRSRQATHCSIKKQKNMFTVSVNLVRLSKAQIEEAISKKLIVPPKYNLRQRFKRENQPKKTEKKKKTKAPTSNAICEKHEMTAERLWVVLKKENTRKIEINMYCLVKMRTFSPWPSKVLESDAKTTKVYFFGDGTTGKIPTNEVVPVKKCAVLMKKLFHRYGYIRAVREMEIYLGIPQHASITKDY